MSEKPNCHKCRYRRDIPGDAHSACWHPMTAAVHANPMAQLVGLLAGGFVPIGAEKLGVTANSHGVRMGWFSWPINFDPTWLLTCDGFETRASDQAVKEMT